MRHLTALLLLALATPALADETSGDILAYDRVAKLIILSDHTVYQLSDATEVSADLVAGDSVTIVYVGGGDAGIGAVTSVLRKEG
jgi:hypothetical protein